MNNSESMTKWCIFTTGSLFWKHVFVSQASQCPDLDFDIDILPWNTGDTGSTCTGTAAPVDIWVNVVVTFQCEIRAKAKVIFHAFDLHMMQSGYYGFEQLKSNKLYFNILALYKLPALRNGSKSHYLFKESSHNINQISKLHFVNDSQS